MAEVERVESAALRECYPVMAQLRPHLSEAAFVERAGRQLGQGYRLAAVREGGRLVAVAGYRLGECLAWGRFLYVDDLVTDAAARSAGYGALLLDWLVAEARAAGCAQLHLDSGVQRFAAHRFYLRRRMEIRSHHFSLELGDAG